MLLAQGAAVETSTESKASFHLGGTAGGAVEIVLCVAWCFSPGSEKIREVAFPDYYVLQYTAAHAREIYNLSN